MEEKSIEPKQEKANVEKKVYTPPKLNVYGKLTDLTAGGSLGEPEGMSSTKTKQRP
jgi:hypothetical protein